ncbi:MAG: flagellar filament capping protein FliD [Burkholderiales bacterium]|nr:flagellar filament capping protein FliD [Burkholderiales bacterium]
MATISASSSIDVSGIVSQLMQIERQPLTAMKTTLTGIQTKLSAFGKLQSALSAMQDAARALTRTDTWRAAKATSSDESAMTATAGSGAITGGYTIEVSQMAQRQTVASSPFAASDTVVGGGTLRIQMGTLDSSGTSFSADAARPEVAINIAEGATLADIRSAINGAGAGVTATLVSDASGQRLMLRSTETGAEQAFRIAVDDTDGNSTDASGLSALAFDPAAAAGAGRNLSMTQAAQNALVTVNGLAVEAKGNKLEGVIENVTIDLKRVTTAPVEIGIDADSAAQRTAIDNFVKSYNEVNKLIASQTAYDAATKTAGTLQGNQNVTRIQQQMREILRSTVAGNTPNSLNAAGIELQRDGSLAVNETKMNKALASPQSLQNLFSALGTSGGDGSDVGLARRLVTRLTDLLGSDGAIEGATESLRARQKSVEGQQTRFESRMTEVEKRLLRQYTALDANLSKITSSFAGIQGLINNLNNSG